MEHNDTKDQTIRETATVTVEQPVDGTKKRKRRSATNIRRAITTTLTLDDCDPRVVAAAKKIRKKGQVFVIEARDVIRIVNS